MIRGLSKPLLIGVLISCLLGGVPRSLARDREPIRGRVDGTVLKLTNSNQTVPAPGLTVTFLGRHGHKSETMTDAKGRYDVNLPNDIYSISVLWPDFCRTRRATVTVQSGDHFTFDFFVVACGNVDLDIEPSLQQLTAMENQPQLNLPSVPLDQQATRYQEQLFPADAKRPEVLVSFGKYDDSTERTEYFPFVLRFINRSSKPYSPLPLLVTITVDKYTIRALDVVLDKKTMVFHASGDVAVSDGKTTVRTHSATLSFPLGLPKMETEN